MLIRMEASKEGGRDSNQNALYTGVKLSKNTLHKSKLKKILKQNTLYFPFSVWNSYS